MGYLGLHLDIKGIHLDVSEFTLRRLDNPRWADIIWFKHRRSALLDKPFICSSS